MKKMSGNEAWIKNRELMLELLKELKITKKTDRLEILRNWITTHNVLSESMSGWSQWLNNVAVLEQIDRSSLRRLFETYKEFVMEFVEFDIKGTKLIDKKLRRGSKTKSNELPEYGV